MEEGGLVYLDGTGNRKGGRIQKLSLMASMAKGRQRLSDITNTTIPAQRNAGSLPAQENLNLGSHPQTKDCIAELLKENTALLRLVGERNKMIEMSALELQKLRISVQQLQQQNCQLAKANTLMLEDLNSGKDRLKALQHELGCTVAALKTTKMELEEKKKLVQDFSRKTTLKKVEQPSSTDCAEEDTVEPLHPGGEKAACNTKRKRASRRRSLGSAPVNCEASPKEKIGIGRRRSSRNSLKSEPFEQKEEKLVEWKNRSSPPTAEKIASRIEDKTIDPSDARSPAGEMKQEDGEEFHSPVDSSKQEDGAGSSSHAPSISGRPQRRSTVGVSYKEQSLRVKMRRN